MSRSGTFPWRRLLLGLLGAVVLLATLCASIFLCLPAWLRWGIQVDECPVGRPVARGYIQTFDLRRDQWRELRVGGLAWYSTDLADEALATSLGVQSVDLQLLHPDGTVQGLQPRKGWSSSRGERFGEIMLPADLPDGDYKLRATLSTRLGAAVVDAPLPLYAPARVHLLTDRPLYEPGNTILMRAVVVRSADRVPLSRRAGHWEVRDPSGELLLEEKAPADEWGVVAGSFPLDVKAQSGAWSITWRSGDALGQAVVRVEPFTLPRFRVEAGPVASWYGIGQRPVLKGKVVYASGAPVPLAGLDLQWRSEGAWPPPTAWTEAGPDALPRSATADAAGRFELLLPAVPADLQGQATLLASLTATDPAGDRVTGSARILLSADDLQVQAVTEMGEGLVEGVNNRVYLRASRPDGQVLPGIELKVRRAWDPADPGQIAQTDEDGVAALQLDPGPAVNVVVPALPIRPPPRRPPIDPPQVQDMLDRGTVRLIDQRAIDEWTGALEPCARFQDQDDELELVLRVEADGRVEPIAAADPLSRCASATLDGRRLPGGEERLYRLRWAVRASDLPRLELRTQAFPSPNAEVEEYLAAMALDARRCLDEAQEATGLPERLQWRARPGARKVELRWLPAGSSALSPGSMACIRAAFPAPSLREDVAVDSVGVIDLRVVPSARRQAAVAQATTRLGYELQVEARRGEASLGGTRLLLDPGRVPPVRLRMSPILAEPGQELTVELLRGPDFQGELPERLQLVHQSGKTQVAALDPKERKARFSLPAEAEGWYSVQYGGAVARAFVPPRGQLELRLETDAERYAPGQAATLRVQTLRQGQGSTAAVGLFGVDESLGQLAALPGPDSLDGLRDAVLSTTPAFGSLDGQALALGRIQGANAAAATILRVSEVPDPAESDNGLSLFHQAEFDPIEPLTERFYPLLAELHAQTRAWEHAAKPGQTLDNPTMATLWAAARDACAARGLSVEDAYGRPLRLHWLPADLLALTDPRAVVVDATRLPEDIDDWSRWVGQEKPR